MDSGSDSEVVIPRHSRNNQVSGDNAPQNTKSLIKSEQLASSSESDSDAPSKRPTRGGRRGAGKKTMKDEDRSSDDDIVSNRPKSTNTTKKADDSDDDFLSAASTSATSKSKQKLAEVEDKNADAVLFRHFGNAQDTSDIEEVDERDSSEYDEKKEMLLQLYSQNKLSQIALWDFKFTHQLHHFILSTSDDTKRTSTTGQDIDFGEKAAIIDATSTIYGYKVQNIFDAASKLIEKNGYGKSGGNDDDLSEKEKKLLAKKNEKLKSRELPKTIEPTDQHTLTDFDILHAYDIVFSEATKNLASSVGIKTLLCFNTSLQPDGVNTICNLDSDPFELYPRSDLLQIDVYQQTIYRLEMQHGTRPNPNPQTREFFSTALGPTATEYEQLQYQTAVIETKQFKDALDIRERNTMKRIDTSINSSFTLDQAFDINSYLPPNVTEQKKTVQSELKKFMAEKEKSGRKSIKSPNSTDTAKLDNGFEIEPVKIHIDTSLQMFLYDIHEKEEHYAKIMSSASNLDDLLDNNVVGGQTSGQSGDNMNFADLFASNLKHDDEETTTTTATASGGLNAGAGVTLTGARRLGKKEIDVEKLQKNAQNVLHRILPRGQARSQFDDDSDAEGEHLTHAQRAKKGKTSQPTDRNSSNLCLVSSTVQHPIYFNKEQVLSAVSAQLMNRSKKSSGSDSSEIPKALLPQLYFANGEFSAQALRLYKAQEQAKMQFDISALQSNQSAHKSVKSKTNDDDNGGDDDDDNEDDAIGNDLYAQLKDVHPDYRFLVNSNYIRNDQVQALLNHAYDESLLHSTAPTPSPTTIKSPARSRSGKGSKSTSQKSDDFAAQNQAQKRKNIFDFSAMAMGKINHLPARLDSMKGGQEEDTYYMSKSEIIDRQHRHSLQKHQRDEDEFYESLNNIVISDVDFDMYDGKAANTMMQGDEIVQLGHHHFSTDPMAQRAQPTLISREVELDFNDYDVGEVYQQDDIQELLQQHEQLQLEQQNAQYTYQGFQQHSSSAQHRESKGQRDIMDMIRSGDIMDDFDNGQDEGVSDMNNMGGDDTVRETSTTRRSSRHVTMTPQGGLNDEDVDKHYQYQFNQFAQLNFGLPQGQLGSLSSSIDTLLANQLRGNAKVMSSVTKAQYAGQDGIREDDQDEGYEFSDDSDDEEGSRIQRRAKKTKSSNSGQLTLIQINMLKKQRKAHRLYQQMLNEQNSSTLSRSKKPKNAKQNMDDDDDDDSDAEIEVVQKKARQKKQKIATFDIASIITSKEIPMTPATSLYLQTAPSLTPSSLGGSAAVKRTKKGDVTASAASSASASGHNFYTSMSSTLDQRTYQLQRRFAEKYSGSKKLTAKQTTFLLNQQTLFEPDEQLEEAAYKKLVKANNTNTTTVSNTGGLNLSLSQKNLLPVYVSQHGSFLQPLLSLNTRNVIFPVHIPAISYQQQTAPPIDQAVFVNLIRSKQVIGGSLNQLSHTYQHQKLLAQRQQHQYKQQQAFSHLVQQMDQNAQQHHEHDHDTMTMGDDHNNNISLGFEDMSKKRTSKHSFSGPEFGENDQNAPFGQSFFAEIQPTDHDNFGSNFDNAGYNDGFDAFADDNADVTPSLDEGQGSGFDFQALQKALDEQNAAMLLKQQNTSEDMDFFAKMQLDHGRFDDDGAEQETSGMGGFQLSSLMSQFGGLSTGIDSNDPFSSRNNLSGAFGGRNEYFTEEESFNSRLNDPNQTDDVLKHATISKYFNMRQLKTRLLLKLTKQNLPRVVLTNFFKIIKQQQQSRNKSVSDDDVKFPEISRDAFEVQKQIANTAPHLLSTSIPASTDSQTMSEATQTVSQVQALKGGQSGECYHTTFKDVVSKIQFEYADDDVRSISTFFLSLLILSNETSLELRPRVDEKFLEMKKSNKDGDNNKAAPHDTEHSSQSTVGNKDPLSLGYLFGDFDIFVPRNAKEIKKTQMQKASQASVPSPKPTPDTNKNEHNKNDKSDHNIDLNMKLEGEDESVDFTATKKAPARRGAAATAPKPRTKPTPKKPPAKATKKVVKKGRKGKYDDEDDEFGMGESSNESELSSSSESSDESSDFSDSE